MVSSPRKQHVKGKLPNFNKSAKGNAIARGEKGHKNPPYRPLAGKKFYLDLKEVRKVASISTDIHHLGGEVEEFFSREVSFLVSDKFDKADSKQVSKSSLHSQTTSRSPGTNSPATPHPPSSVLSASNDSPIFQCSPREETRKKVRTRGEALLERACVRRQGSTDIVETARSFSVPVWTYTELLNKLTRLKASSLYTPVSHRDSKSTSKADAKIPAGRGDQKRTDSSSSNVHAKKLKAPFLKAESFNGLYRPVFKELNIWPELRLEGAKETSSPFVYPNTDTVKLKKQHNSQAKEKAGYCELCEVNYTALQLHLQSNAHQAFIHDADNYALLDELIRGPLAVPQSPGTAR